MMNLMRLVDRIPHPEVDEPFLSLEDWKSSVLGEVIHVAVWQLRVD